MESQAMSKAKETPPTPVRFPAIHVLLGAAMLAAGIWMGGGCMKPKPAPAAPSYETCAKCSHLFATGSGKHVLEFGATNAYCSTDAPKWDRREMTIVWERNAGRSGSGYFIHGPEWVPVDASGERLDKVYVTNVVEKECNREHWPGYKWTPGIIVTNSIWWATNRGMFEVGTATNMVSQ
jgi:hypothetical protein